MVTENKSVISWSKYGERWITKGSEKILEQQKMYVFLIVLMVSQVHKYVKTIKLHACQMFNLFTLNMSQQSWAENLELLPVPICKVKSVSQGVCIIRPLPHTGLISSHFSHMFYVVTELKSISSLQYFSSISFVGFQLFHIVSPIWKVHRYSYSPGKQLLIFQNSDQCLEHSRCSISNCLVST